MSFAKKKGWHGEHDIAEWATRITGVKFVRTPGSGAMHQDWPSDIMKKENKPTIFDGIGIEVKNTVQLSHPSWIEQAQIAALHAGQAIPKWFIAFKHKGKWYFTLNQTYFEQLLSSEHRALDKSQKEE